MPFFSFPRNHVAGYDLLGNVRIGTDISLGALKIYLLLLARRDWDGPFSRATYKVMEDATGVARKDINPSLSLLTENSLIQRGRLVTDDVYTVRYFIRGLGSQPAAAAWRGETVRDDD